MPIASARMKARRDHNVPLSQEARNVLRLAREYQTDDRIFFQFFFRALASLCFVSVFPFASSRHPVSRLALLALSLFPLEGG